MEKIVRFRFRGKLIKMIRDATSKSDDCLIWPKIRHILSHWGYELKKIFFYGVDQLTYKNEILLV